MAKVPIDRDLLALLRAVKESPFDDLPRMILADWLDDRDDPRGELIRVQCELKKTPFGHPNRESLVARESSLLKAHGVTWKAGNRRGVKVRFQRGLLHLTVDIHRDQAIRFPSSLRPALEQGWVETVRFKGDLGETQLAHYQPLQHVTQVDLSECYLYGDQLERIAESKYLQQLTVIRFGSSGRFPFQTLTRVAQSKFFPRLQYVAQDCDGWLGHLRELYRRHPELDCVDLSFETGDDEFEARFQELAPLAAERPTLLNLTGQHLEPERLVSVLDHPRSRRLRGLILSHCGLDRKGIERLARSPHLRELEVLHLGHNWLSDDDVITLAEVGSFPELVYLQLEYNGVGDPGVTALANAPHPGKLKLLDLGPNRVGDRGMVALAKSPYLKNLELLSIWDNDVSDEGLVAWFNSPNGSNLRELYAGNNRISDVGAQAALESPFLDHLHLLRFENNNSGSNNNDISGAMRKNLKARFSDGIEVEVDGPLS